MEDYPTEEEEFEIRYQEELELFQAGIENNDEPIELHPSEEEQPCCSKSIPSVNASNTLPSPQLSQISLGSSSGAVNRRLFGTPQSHERGSSTPFPSKRLAPISEVVLPTVGEVEEINEYVPEFHKRRRLERDLFGDIDDIDGNITYIDPIAKKMKTEEERDLYMIDKILETRSKLRENSTHFKTDNLEKLNALHAFKLKNLSLEVPQWPFIPIVRSDDERIYIRFHSQDYETRAINDLNFLKNDFGGLLGSAKQQIWQGANDIILKKTSVASETSKSPPNVINVPKSADACELWVEKYKPQKYLDLLSDEMTNRSLLYWLKMWDKVVFGKEFKRKEINSNGQLRTFNVKTGKFESNGGWQKRKPRQNLNKNCDDLGRPIQKIALLCGPPGLGKTALAHTIARHAGYEVREINASDDRNPEAFRLTLENCTQMSAVLNENKRPNCVVLDEIDGAPKQSIEFLIKFVTDNISEKVRTKGGKSKRNTLKRPVICICNDVYEPALRQLRQIAFIVTFPPIDSARLAERLQQIARKERLVTDFGALITLAEKSGNDVRSCISTMQFFNSTKRKLTLQDVLNSNVGQKDRHRGLFDVWNTIFHIQRPMKKLESSDNVNNPEPPQVVMTDMSVSSRIRYVSEVVSSTGDYEILIQGVHENYLKQKMPDPNLNGIVSATQWFSFADILSNQINQQQNYTIYPYLQVGFVAWHLLFASHAWPKLNFPTCAFEFHKKSATRIQVFQAFRKGLSPGSVGIGCGNAILLDTVPHLKRILSPRLRSVTLQLLSQREREDLKHTVYIMVDLGLSFIQVKSAEGQYIFQMEPDIEMLIQFPDSNGIVLTYFARQLISREVELERLRRSAPKTSTNNQKSNNKIINSSITKEKSDQIIAITTKPNHLQTLKPKSVKTTKNDVVSKDFFGRIQHRSDTGNAIESIDPIVKSPIWYRYKEGFNNAVRKEIHMHELL